MRNDVVAQGIDRIKYLANPNRVERRRHPRFKLEQRIRVRPSEFTEKEFDEIRYTLNVSKEGLYFMTDNPLYTVGMRVFVTIPYNTAPGGCNLDYIGRVVRVVEMPEGNFGVAVQLLQPFTLK